MAYIYLVFYINLLEPWHKLLLKKNFCLGLIEHPKVVGKWYKVKTILCYKAVEIGLCTCTRWRLRTCWSSESAEPTQRRVYGCAASALRCGGGAKKFSCWEGEPQRRLMNTATTSLYICLVHSNHGILSTASPFSLCGTTIYRTAPIYDRVYLTGGRPALPGSLSIFLWGLGWGPRARYMYLAFRGARGPQADIYTAIYTLQAEGL